MPGRIYSERLISQQGVGAVAWGVPSGFRVVIRNILTVNGGATSAFGYVTGAGFTLWMSDFQAVRSATQIDMRAVVYAGESLVVYCSAAELSVSVHGYMFEDVYGRRAELAEQKLEPADPLPWPAGAGYG